jgi:hypothetical protein
MGFIYKIEVAGELYIGSTKEKYLCFRQKKHNQGLNNPICKNYNTYLYRFCREHNVSKIICELIEEVDDSELILIEQEYMNMLEPTLNTNRAYRTEEERLEYHKKYHKIKSNCPICDKLMLKQNIKQHISRIH